MTLRALWALPPAVESSRAAKDVLLFALAVPTTFGATRLSFQHDCVSQRRNPVPRPQHRWGNAFTAQGRTITGGYLLLGANTDGGDHRAKIGIYTGGPFQLTGELGAVTVPVSGYGGVSFSFANPITVAPGQGLWIAATGVGDFTAYDQNNSGINGCFIGNVTGRQ